jgi:hypothetical protein
VKNEKKGKEREGEKVELNKNEATNEKITNEELKFGFFSFVQTEAAKEKG